MMASCSEQAMVSIEKPKVKITKSKIGKLSPKVILTKRLHETNTSKSHKSSPNDKLKVARVSPIKSSPTVAITTTCNCKWTDSSKKQRDLEMEKIRRNLQRCQDELREEVTKRGVSSAGRAASDRDRGRLLSEIKQLGVSKRRLESALETASVAVKKMEGDVRAVREACKQQVSGVEKTSALEVKKLLEDLKTKDQMLASLDRNQYSDRSVQLKIVQHKQLQQQQQKQQQQQQKQQEEQQSIKEQLTQEIKKELQVQLERDIKKEIQHKLQQEMQQKLKLQMQQQHESFMIQLKEHRFMQESSLKQQKDAKKDHNIYISSLKSEITKLEAKIHKISEEKDDIFKESKKILEEKKYVEKKMNVLKEENDKMAQTLSKLQEEVSGLHESLADSTVEGVLRQFERLKRLSEEQKKTIERLNELNEINKLSKIKSSAKVGRNDKKSVRFLLPDSKKPIVNGRVAYKEDMRFLFFDDDDDNDDDDNDDDDDDDEDKDEDDDDDEDDEDDEDEGCHDNDEKTPLPTQCEKSVEYKAILSSPMISKWHDGDYQKLMNEHLRLEQAYSNLSNKKDWEVERENLNLAMIALEGKSQEYEGMAKQLTLQLEESNDKNEELEFQVLELEGCRSDFKSSEETEDQVQELKEKSRILQDQVTALSKGIHLMNEHPDHEEAPKMNQSVQCLIAEEVKKEICTDFEATTMTTTTTSGIEDFSSDEDEASIESMPQDNDVQSNAIPCYSEARKLSPSEDNSKQLIKTVEKLELRLACSKLREINLLDRIALLCEEKKRLFTDVCNGEESMVDEYVGIEKDLNSVVFGGENMDGSDSGVNEDLSESHDDKYDNDAEQENEKDEVMRSVDVNKVAAKLRMSILFDKSTEGGLWMEECLRLDTPTREEYPHYIQSLTGEDENEGLNQKVQQLEQDSEALRQVVDMDEGVIRELQVRLFDLENLEKVLQSALEKSENVEKACKKSNDELEENNERLRRELIRMKSSEESLQSHFDISRCNEQQLRKKLEEVSQDLKETEKKLRKKSALAEKLQENAKESNEKFEDQVGELESVIELFKKRNSNLERLCEDLNGKLMEAERQGKRLKMQAECMEQQRDTFVQRIQSLEKERASLLEKLSLTNKGLEEKCGQVEMAVVEANGLRICLEACERERDELMVRLEGQKDVEMLLTEEVELLTCKLSAAHNNISCLAQDKMIVSSNCQSQTCFEDLYQEESSVHYNEYESEDMKVSLTFPRFNADSPDSIGLLCDYYDNDTYENFSICSLRRTKSLNDLNLFICQKATQTTSSCHRPNSGRSLIPINKTYLNCNSNLLSHPPSISQPTNLSSIHPLSPIFYNANSTGASYMGSPLLAFN